MKKNLTELALSFLSARNPFDEVPHSTYVFCIMDLQDNKGNEAVEALAGFYLYAIRNIGGEKGSHAIATTFAHDLSGSNDKWCQPRSFPYRHVWIDEMKHYAACIDLRKP